MEYTSRFALRKTKDHNMYRLDLEILERWLTMPKNLPPLH